MKYDGSVWLYDFSWVYKKVMFVPYRDKWNIADEHLGIEEWYDVANVLGLR